MPERSRGSESDSETTRSKLRTGGHVVKSGLATTEMSFSVPVSSRSGTASTRTRTPLPICMRPRSRFVHPRRHLNRR